MPSVEYAATSAAGTKYAIRPHHPARKSQFFIAARVPALWWNLIIKKWHDRKTFFSCMAVPLGTPRNVEYLCVHWGVTFQHSWHDECNPWGALAPHAWPCLVSLCHASAASPVKNCLLFTKRKIFTPIRLQNIPYTIKPEKKKCPSVSSLSEREARNGPLPPASPSPGLKHSSLWGSCLLPAGIKRI